MALPLHFLAVYGYALLFAWVLVEQMGIPLPATPVLIAAGGLSARPDALAPGLCGGACGGVAVRQHLVFRGPPVRTHVLRLLCKLSLEPTTCVRRTQDSFGRRRGNMLMSAKFVPGLAMLAPPVAGQNGMDVTQFLFFDGIGAALWAGADSCRPALWRRAQSDPRLLDWAARFSGVLLMAALIAVLAARILRRRAVLRTGRCPPGTRGTEAPARCRRKGLHRRPAPSAGTAAGALHSARRPALCARTLAARHSEIPRDRDIVLYCTCPSEATAAKTALTLHKLGIERVRPLRGGFDEWKRLGFPLDAFRPCIRWSFRFNPRS